MKYLIPIFLFLLISCQKDYRCACDADGVAPIQNDIVFNVDADSKSEARKKCMSSGDECGLYPID